MASEMEAPIQLTGKVWPVDVDYLTGETDEIERGCLKGDILLAPNLDAHGRGAVRGRHTNLGYSGHLVGLVFDGVKRRKIVGWRRLFPDGQNSYPQQSMRAAAEQRVAEAVAQMAGRMAVRVKGGWSIVEAKGG